MCNEYQLRVRRADYDAAFRAVGADVLWLDPEPNRPLDSAFRPTDRAPILRRSPEGRIEGLEARWWLVPAFHRGPVSGWKAMCTNARMETAATAPSFRESVRSGRCLAPVTAIFEYDVPPGWRRGQPKRRWEVSWPPDTASGPVRFLAGLYARSRPVDMPEGLDSFAIITRPAGPDMSRIHDRQPVILTRDEGLAWLDRGDLEALPPPGPSGALILREAPRPHDD
ncbi:MAG: SOS response-associated peptidase [Phenylobacterium sp.]